MRNPKKQKDLCLSALAIPRRHPQERKLADDCTVLYCASLSRKDLDLELDPDHGLWTIQQKGGGSGSFWPRLDPGKQLLGENENIKP